MGKEPGEQIDTLIGERTKIKGDLRFSGGLHIDGHVDGSVLAEGAGEEGQVVISERGSIKGKVKAPRVIVNGTIDGDIDSSSRVELQENAKVNGNIQYQNIEMRLGAQVTGQLMVRNGGRDTLEKKP